MEKQHSSKFFSLFLENLRILCRSYLAFDHVVEVSGYVCLDFDNCKKERYFLSELIQNSGTVSSSSCCAQVLTTSPVVAPIPADQTMLNKQTLTSPVRDSEVEPTQTGAKKTVLKYSVSENSFTADTDDFGGETTDVAETVQSQTSGRIDKGRCTVGETESGCSNDEELHIKQEVEDVEVVSIPNTTFLQNSDEVKQLKERIQAISNAKMAVPWLGTPLINSVRNVGHDAGEQTEMQSPDKYLNGQSVYMPSATASHSTSSCFPVHLSGPEILKTSESNSIPNVNASVFIQNGAHAIRTDSLMNRADVNFGIDLSGLGTNYKLHHVLNTPSRRSGKPKTPPTYRVRQNWRYAVRQFENFLRFKGLEVVPIYTIPPIQLDEMLCEFIKWVKKNNGEDFHPWSVKNFFYHLEYHLKEFGYGSSITKGVEFKRSRDVLRQKVIDLETKLHEASQIC